MLEVEIKAFLDGLSSEKIAAAAKELGFRKCGVLQETDIYFNGNDRNFMKTDEALRIRSCGEQGEDGVFCREETFITYKGPKLDKNSNTRLEFETSVGDCQTMAELLTALGYREAFTVKKVRREWKLIEEDGREITLCFDRVENLGDYMELETLAAEDSDREQAVKRLLELLDFLGVSGDRMTRKSYLEMLIAKM